MTYDPPLGGSSFLCWGWTPPLGRVCQGLVWPGFARFFLKDFWPILVGGSSWSVSGFFKKQSGRVGFGAGKVPPPPRGH